ncbi:MAG: hypothetical protein LC808_01985 [Actinobacteria bacterium]|nr:hypothetical protein [Actinomycetota bacterium]
MSTLAAGASVLVALLAAGIAIYAADFARRQAGASERQAQTAEEQAGTDLPIHAGTPGTGQRRCWEREKQLVPRNASLWHTTTDTASGTTA